MSAPPTWFKVVAVIALVWNVLGCLAILADLMIGPEQLAQMTPEQQELYASRTWWSTTASIVAVLGGAVGSLGLVLRKTWAMPFLAASLGGVVVQDIGLFLVADAFRLAGPAAAVIQAVVLLIAVGLVAMARTASSKNWIPKKSSEAT